MFLSIIIPIWNDEKYLAECLDSCLNQDIPYDDYEIICVDDGSTDNTPKILADYAKRYANVVVINKEHGKDSGRNVGFRVAKGDYIWFVDHDDLIEENVLALLKEKAAAVKSDRIVFSYYEFQDELSQKEKNLKSKGQLLPSDDILLDKVVWTSIIKRSFLSENDIWPKSKRLGEKNGWSIDTLFIYELKQHDVCESMLLGTPYYYYRRSAGSETGNRSKASMDAQYYGTANIASVLYQDYIDTKNSNSVHCIRAADSMMILLRRCTRVIAESPANEYREKKKYLKENGLFPMRVPKESTYQIDYFWNEQNGKSKWYNLLRFYSTTEAGLFALSVPHRLQRLKLHLSRAMRKNKLMNRLLDFKNKLLRR